MAAKKTVNTEEVKVVEEAKVEAVTEVSAVEEAPVTEEKAPKKTRKACGTKKTKKVEPKATEIVIQFQGSEITATSLEEKVKAKFVEEGHRAGNIKSLTIYAKPEELAAYYVINEHYKGRVDLF